jgi:hypothetical protein
MIKNLVKSAIQTGCLSVASEGLMLQVINRRAYQSQDLEALTELQAAVDLGTVQREAPRSGSHILGKLLGKLFIS